jgi:hypothetical protein
MPISSFYFQYIWILNSLKLAQILLAQGIELGCLSLGAGAVYIPSEYRRALAPLPKTSCARNGHSSLGLIIGCIFMNGISDTNNSGLIFRRGYSEAP